MSKIVVTEPFYLGRDDCGYCHGKKDERFANEYMKSILGPSESFTIGASIQFISTQDYDDFMNMGFRRSGDFLYKTDMLRNCCRYYTIRTNCRYLKVKKNHRQVINRFIAAISDNTSPTHNSNKNRKNKPFNLEDMMTAELNSKRFKTQFQPSTFTEEKYELYKKYQVKVHNDLPEDVSESQFKRFLCDSLFKEEEINGTDEEWDSLNSWVENAVNKKNPKAQRLGPTHECYYLDGKLIAFSVIDFLPSGVSSVYFVWDPDYAHLSLGTLSGLREILMVEKLSLDYYYLGYYIADCPKMVYKGQFGGELLDVCNETYYPLTEVEPYIKNSNLFVLGAKEQTQEFHLTSKYPQSVKTKENTIPLENIVDQIYNQQTFDNAQKTVDTLSKDVKLTDEFPPVVPGLIPVAQLQELIDSGNVEQITMGFYLRNSGKLIYKNFSEMNQSERSSFIICLRVFGFIKVSRIILVVL
ncbi:arginyl-tRNA--protein transferase 1 [[Candida] jaroonii]|uniref:Arginyl-tRNA--protein transferase 1 n=1 Tax=[Candida] jaroonii TaxID=467808 RepID=A0ACA9YAB9_9ASCO|nr:arginyl-tRNA--protein transferase 1 [[Candida] jaroonii]